VPENWIWPTLFTVLDINLHKMLPRNKHKKQIKQMPLACRFSNIFIRLVKKKLKKWYSPVSPCGTNCCGPTWTHSRQSTPTLPLPSYQPNVITLPDGQQIPVENAERNKVLVRYHLWNSLLMRYRQQFYRFGLSKRLEVYRGRQGGCEYGGGVSDGSEGSSDCYLVTIMVPDPSNCKSLKKRTPTSRSARFCGK